MDNKNAGAAGTNQGPGPYGAGLPFVVAQRSASHFRAAHSDNDRRFDTDE